MNACVDCLLACLQTLNDGARMIDNRSSESNQVMGAGVDFVPVERFEEKGIRTHVCEVQNHLSFRSKGLQCAKKGIDLCFLSTCSFYVQVQLMLESFNTLKVEKCHASFVKSRNLLSQ